MTLNEVLTLSSAYIVANPATTTTVQKDVRRKICWTECERRSEMTNTSKIALVAILAMSLFGNNALAKKEIPTVPVWLDKGIMCDEKIALLQTIDEINTPLPFPEGCHRIYKGYELIVTIEFLETYETNGYVYDIVRFTVGGYRYMTQSGMEFTHFHEDGKLILETKYGYWNKTKIEDVEPETEEEDEPEDEPDVEPEPVGQRI